MFKKYCELITNKTVANQRQYVIQIRTRSTHASTVNNAEVSNFKKFAGAWWDELGEMKGLHAMNSIRVPFIRNGLKHRGKLHANYVNTSKPLEGLRILDAGCGGGILCEPLAKLGAQVTGLDACEDLVECARVHASWDVDIKDSLRYVHGVLEEFSNDNKNAFDAVVSSETLEHIDSKDLFVKSCVEVLKPGGSLFLTTMNKTRLSWLAGVIAAEYIFNVVPKGTHDWNKFVAPHEVQKMLELRGCQTHVLHGMFYNFIANQWIWCPDTSVNYALHAIKLN